jgi:hypothetical protein
MRPKNFAVKVIPKGGIQRETVGIDAEDRHLVSQSPLHIWPTTQEMDWTIRFGFPRVSQRADGRALHKSIQSAAR